MAMEVGGLRILEMAKYGLRLAFSQAHIQVHCRESLRARFGLSPFFDIFKIIVNLI